MDGEAVSQFVKQVSDLAQLYGWVVSGGFDGEKLTLIVRVPRLGFIDTKEGEKV